MRALIAIAVAALALIAATHHTPRLVGHGCTGAQGPLYADEEDEFPACERIERR